MAPVANILGVTSLFQERCQIQARKDAKIASAPDLKGMRAGVGVAGMQGFLLDDDKWYERLILLAVAFCLVKPGLYSDIIGLIGFALIYFLQKRRVGAHAAAAA